MRTHLLAVVILGVLPAPAWAAELPAISQALQLAGEGIAAGEANDTETYVAKLEEAVALRPDVPRLLANLAAAQVAAERFDDAIATLERMAAMGITSPVDESDDFAPLREREDFAEVVKTFEANSRPRGSGEIAFTLRDVTGLIEGIAWREKTGKFFFGDVNGRAVWVRSEDRKLRRFTPDTEELLGVFGIAIDESTATLWAATSAVPAMRGYTSDLKGTAALAEIDLGTGELRRTYPLPPPEHDESTHLLGDLAVSLDGSVYITDSGEPVLWRLAPGDQAIERFVENPEFISLQGIVLLSGRGAVIADRLNGLLQVSLDDGSVLRLEAPADTTLVGIDGLVAAPDGSLIAIQNDTRPTRVLRIELDAAAETVTDVTVLESGHYTMAAPSHGCIGSGGDLYFIGNAGWPHFVEDDGEPTEPRPVPVFKTSLGSAKAK